MITSPQGIAFIKSYEKCRLTSYLPTLDDVWTIGWGTTLINGKPVEPKMTITQAQADLYFIAHLKSVEESVNKIKKPLKQNQFDALVSLVYNIGASAFANSTLVKKINLGDPLAHFEFERWVFQEGKRLKGLERRRFFERAIYQFGVYIENR